MKKHFTIFITNFLCKFDLIELAIIWQKIFHWPEQEELLELKQEELLKLKQEESWITL